MNKRSLISILMVIVLVFGTSVSAIPAKAGKKTTYSEWKDVRIAGYNSESVTLGLKKNGELYSWGENSNGSLNGHGEDAAYPRLLMTNIKTIEASCGHMAAIDKKGTLYMWGNSFHGALGEKSTGGRIRYPIKVMDNVKSVRCVEGMTAVITKTGDLYVFGDNYAGRLGINSKEEYVKTPTKVMSGVKSVVMTLEVTAALTKKGNLYTWGAYGYGTLGQGREVGSSSRPVKILSGISQISAGYRSMLAVTKKGKLYAWGGNGEDAQLCEGHQYIESIPHIMKTKGKVASAQYMGYDSIGYLTTTGDLYFTGAMARIGKNKTRKYVKALSNVASFAFDPRSSGNHTIGAVTKDGKLYTWGGNKDVGCLGNGTEKGDVEKPKKIMSGVSKVVFGSYLGAGAGAAIKKDGSLWLWGSGKSGRQANGSNDNKPTPHEVITLQEALFPKMEVESSGSIDRGLSVRIYPEGKGKASVEYRCNQNPLPRNLSAEELGDWFTSQGYDLSTLEIKKSIVDGVKYVDITASNNSGQYGTWTLELTKEVKSAGYARKGRGPYDGAIDVLEMIVNCFKESPDKEFDQLVIGDSEYVVILEDAAAKFGQVNDSGQELDSKTSWNLALSVCADQLKQKCMDKLTKGIPSEIKSAVEKIKEGFTGFITSLHKV